MTQSINDLDFDARQKLLRLVIEKVTVTGWRVEIHLKIPLTTNQPPPTCDPSNDVRLCSTDFNDVAVVRQATEDGGGDDGIAEHLTPFADGLVAGEQDTAPLVSGGDELNELGWAALVVCSHHAAMRSNDGPRGRGGG